MPTLKIQKADGTFEFLQLAGEEFADIGNQVLDVKSRLTQIAIQLTDFNRIIPENDDTGRIQRFLNIAEPYDKLIIPKGEFTFSGTLTMNNKSHITLECYGTLKYTGMNEDAFVISGGQRKRFHNLKIQRDYVREGKASDQLLYNGLIIRNSKYDTFYSLYVEGFRRGIYLNATESSTAYNHFYEPSIFNCLISYENDFVNGFSNEIKTFGGRFSITPGAFDNYEGSAFVKIAQGSDMHVFYGVTMESAVVERKIVCNGSYNVFDSCRFEYSNASGVDIEVNGICNYFIANRMSESAGGSKIIEGPNALYNVYMQGRHLSIDTSLKRRVKPVQLTTGSYAINNSDTYLMVDSSQKSFTSINLATNENSKGRELTVFKTDDTPNYVQFINNQGTIHPGLRLTSKNDFATFIHTGTEWLLKECSQSIKGINHNCTKLADGTMILSQRVEISGNVTLTEGSLFRSGFLTINLPVSFIDNSYTTAVSVATNGGHRGLWAGAVESETSSRCRLQLISTSAQSNLNVLVHVQCIGRWK